MTSWTPRAALVLTIVASLGITAAAQWVQFPTPNVPRLPNGRPNLEAPAPRTSDGHPDLSGIWLPRGRYIQDLATDLKPGDVPFQPWAADLYKHRQETLSKDDPQGRCVLSGVPRANFVPYPFKIVNTTN